MAPLSPLDLTIPRQLHKAINTGKVIPMNYNKYNPRCNSLTKWSCGDDGAIGEDDGDDDPDEARGDDDGYDFPLRERIFPADFSLLERFSLSVVSTPESAAEYFPAISSCYSSGGAVSCWTMTSSGSSSPPCSPSCPPV